MIVVNTDYVAGYDVVQILEVRFTSSAVMQGACELYCFGTAAVIGESN